jgi:raffinose/stachyose/melibiose transport system substrate-binding protein
MPALKPGTVTAATLGAGAKIAADNSAMDFIANATGAIYAKSWTPQLQKLFAGQQTPDGLLKSVQSDYARQVGS